MVVHEVVTKVNARGGALPLIPIQPFRNLRPFALPDTGAIVETNRPPRIEIHSNIYRDWVDACRGEKRNMIASFDSGGPLSELLMLGNIATLFPEEMLI